MMNFLRKHKVKIFLITIFGFLAGTFVGFGSYLFGDRNYYDTVAVVNNVKIPYKIYYSLYNNRLETLRQTGQDITEEIKKDIQNDIVRNLIQDEIIWQQTKDYGITVSDKELAADIQAYPYFLNENGQFDIRYYYKFLNNIRLSPKDFESLRRKQIASKKLQMLVASAAKISDTEIQNPNNYSEQVNALQIKANEILNDWFDTIKRKTKIKITLQNNA
jgi:hypothetical protein